MSDDDVTERVNRARDELAAAYFEATAAMGHGPEGREAFDDAQAVLLVDVDGVELVDVRSAAEHVIDALTREGNEDD